jgi:hypothetical protein
MARLNSLATDLKEKVTRSRALASDLRAAVTSMRNVHAIITTTITSDAPAMALAPVMGAMKSVSDAGTVTIGTTIGQDRRIRTNGFQGLLPILPFST